MATSQVRAAPGAPLTDASGNRNGFPRPSVINVYQN